MKSLLLILCLPLASFAGEVAAKRCSGQLYNFMVDYPKDLGMTQPTPQKGCFYELTGTMPLRRKTKTGYLIGPLPGLFDTEYLMPIWLETSRYLEVHQKLEGRVVYVGRRSLESIDGRSTLINEFKEVH